MIYKIDFGKKILRKRKVPFPPPLQRQKHRLVDENERIDVRFFQLINVISTILPEFLHFNLSLALSSQLRIAVNG